jgi:RNA polymerase sigma-70 factor, ECF subfamily
MSGVLNLANLWNLRVSFVMSTGGKGTAVTDDELVGRFRHAGDAQAFAELFARHGKRIYAVCRQLLRDAGMAEDATQEAFLRAHQKVDQYQGGSFEAWLIRIARNACIDQLRRLQLATELTKTQEPEQSSGLSFEHQVDLRFAVERLLHEMSGLPPEQRLCLELKIEGYSYEETAAQTGLSTDAVKSHLQNGRRMLWLKLKGVLAELK